MRQKRRKHSVNFRMPKVIIQYKKLYFLWKNTLTQGIGAVKRPIQL